MLLVFSSWQEMMNTPAVVEERMGRVRVDIATSTDGNGKQRQEEDHAQHELHVCAWRGNTNTTDCAAEVSALHEESEFPVQHEL